MTNNSPRLTVIIPAYNEAENIEAGSLAKVAGFLALQDYSWEALIVDDGSEDETATLAEAFAAEHGEFRVIRNPHRGKAYTVITGLLNGRGEVLLFTDMDQATPISETAKVLPWFDNGYDVVFGSRGTVRQDAPRWRLFMSNAQIVLRDAVLGIKGVTDTQCGFKAFRREAAHNIIKRLSLYGHVAQNVHGSSVTSGFDVEMLFVAQKLGYKLREVEVEWSYRRTRRVNLLKDSFRGVRDLVQIRQADHRGAYNKVREIDLSTQEHNFNKDRA